MAVLEIIFAGLIAHFGFPGGSTAVLLKEGEHSPILAVIDPQGDTSFLGHGKSSGSTVMFSLRGQHIRVILPYGQTTHDASFDKGVPHLLDVTGGSKPLGNVTSGSAHPHVSAYVDYSGGTLYSDCYFKDEEKLELGGHVSGAFCPAVYTHFKATTNDTRITIENEKDRTQTFTVPADSTIYVYNTSDMEGGFDEYRWMIDDDKGIAKFKPTGNSCSPYCDVPKIPGFPFAITSVTVECVNTQWP